jgi:hypothetical protein
MRRAGRGPTPNPQAERLLQACLDLVEQLARQPDIVTVDEVEKTLAVLHQAAAELDDETPATSAVVASIQQAMGRLQTLRTEISAK